jgi:hypothetical protein
MHHYGVRTAKELEVRPSSQLALAELTVAGQRLCRNLCPDAQKATVLSVEQLMWDPIAARRSFPPAGGPRRRGATARS